MKTNLLASLTAALLLTGSALAQEAHGNVLPDTPPATPEMPQAVVSLAEEVERLRAISTPEAQLRLGDILRDGLPVSKSNPLRRKDLAGARIAYQRALSLGGRKRADAATRLAKLMLEGEGGVQDVTQGRRLLQTALEAGNAEAAQILATHFEHGRFGEADLRKAEELYRTAFRLGDSKAGADLVRLLGRDTPAGIETAKVTLKRLEQEAAEGQVSSAVLLGDLTLRGELGPADEKQAVHWYELAAKQGSDKAKYRLARLYSSKQAGAHTEDAARQWMIESADTGRTEAALAIVLDGLWGGNLGFTRENADLWLGRAREVDEPRALVVSYVLNAASGIADTAKPGSRAELKAFFERLALEPSDANSIGRAMLGSENEQMIGAALTLFDYAASSGDTNGKYLFGRTILDRPALFGADLRPQAIERLQDAASDSAGAAIRLARAYLDGTIADRSIDRAKELYLAAIDRADLETRADAMTDLAALLIEEGDPPSVKDAVAWYERAADLGSVEAILSLGRLYADGQFLPRDRLSARMLLQRAADLGSIDGQVALGEFLLSSGTSETTNEAEALFQKAWDAGDVRGLNRLADIYIGKDDAARARKLLESAAKPGNLDAALRLMRMDASVGNMSAAQKWLKSAETSAGADVHRLYRVVEVLLEAPAAGLRQEAGRILRTLADAGNVDARIRLNGVIARGGLAGMSREDAVKALEADVSAGHLRAKAELARVLSGDPANGGDPVRAFKLNTEVFQADPTDGAVALSLGRAYAGGEGVERDTNRAFAFYDKAARLGNLRAMAAVGTAYAHGVGTARDSAKAEFWLRRAAASNDLPNLLRLADFYGSGEAGIIKTNLALATRFQAARLGSAEAMIAIGHAYMAGAGLPRDTAEGLAWLKRGVASGDTTAMLELARVYDAGTDGAASASEALKLLKQAAEAGNPDGMYRYAIALTEGPHGKQNSETALEWLKKARAADRDVAERDIARLSAAETE